ncbi:hypothetical protein C8J57DRAFT_1476474 [Mycena rebaudengoi]|nr:hypothetical protein C8J57DRAFT_1476474 [Mycena rebaudengoi]
MRMVARCRTSSPQSIPPQRALLAPPRPRRAQRARMNHAHPTQRVRAPISPARRHPVSTRAAYIQRGSTHLPRRAMSGSHPASTRMGRICKRRTRRPQRNYAAKKKEVVRKGRSRMRGRGVVVGSKNGGNAVGLGDRTQRKGKNKKERKECAYAFVVRDVHRGGGGKCEKGRGERVGRRAGRRRRTEGCVGLEEGGAPQYRVGGWRGEEDERVCFARGRARDGQQRHVVQPGRVSEELALGLQVGQSILVSQHVLPVLVLVVVAWRGRCVRVRGDEGVFGGGNAAQQCRLRGRRGGEGERVLGYCFRESIASRRRIPQSRNARDKSKGWSSKLRLSSIIVDCSTVSWHLVKTILPPPSLSAYIEPSPTKYWTLRKWAANADDAEMVHAAAQRTYRPMECPTSS